MARRSTIGDDPLDQVIPPLPRGGRAAGDDRPAGGETRPRRERAATAPVPAERAQFLTFSCGGETFALELLRIREILQPIPVTRVPMTPDWVQGVMNLRGSVLPVLDLAAKLALPPASGDRRRACVVIVEVELWADQVVMGLVVDGVNQVVEMAPEETERPPAFGTRVHLDYLAGLGKVNGEFVLLLDIDRVLSEEELLVAASLEAPDEREAEDAAGGDGAGEEAAAHRDPAASDAGDRQ